MSCKNFFATICFAAFAMFALPALAEWSTGERAEFTRDCLEACRNNPNVSTPFKPKCVDYCDCVMQSAERIEPTYKLLNDDFLSGRETDRVRSVKGSVPACNTKAFR